MNLQQVRKDLNMGMSLSSMNLRVTYYSRVSTDNIKQHTSLINQSEYFDEMIKNNTNWTYISGYIDDGISGTNVAKRNNFLKMIEDAKKEKFDLIITKEISRFSRNTLDSIMYTRKLLSYGVAVLFVNDNINTALPDAELRLTIMASLAQDEIRRLSERVKFGMSRSIKNGTILGNDMLYGYKKNKLTGELKIIPNEAKIVKRIFNMFVLENKSVTEISKILDKEKIKTSQNKKWCTTTIIRMIKNIKYKGYYCGGKSETVDYMSKMIKKIPTDKWVIYKDDKKIPPIIADEIWNRANIKMKLLSKKQCHKKYFFSSKIFCKNDGCVFHRRKQCKSTDDITWLCSVYLREGKDKCNSANIRESELYKVLEVLLLKLDININDIISMFLSYYDPIFENEIRTKLKKEEINKIIIEKITNRILVSASNNNINLEIYTNYKNDKKCEYTEIFKRGYNTTGTKRYSVKYNVFLCSGE